MNENQIIKYIPVSQLIFDPENPRLPSTLRKKKDASNYQEEVIAWMLTSENVLELMGSIGEKGFFPAEPLLAVPNSSGQYEVVEGNRRLTAIKLLNNPELAPKRKKAIDDIVSEAKVETTEVPTLIFKHRNEILAYLGYKHITGVESWDSLAKAKYLKQLIETLPPNDDLYTKCKTLAKIIGSKASYVRLLLIGVDVYYKVEENDFFQISSLGEENFEFGVFYTAIGRSNISNYIGVDFDSQDPIVDLNLNHLEDLTKWIFEEQKTGGTRLGESRNLTKLDKILNPDFQKALKVFKEGKTLDEAARLTDHPSEIFQSSLDDSLFLLETARDYLHEVDEPTSAQLEIVKQIFRIASDMGKLIQSKRTNFDEEFESL